MNTRSQVQASQAKQYYSTSLPLITHTLVNIRDITHKEVGLQYNDVHSTVLLCVFYLWQ